MATAYTNLKTFVSAVVKPYITALETYYKYSVTYMLDHLTVQEASITSLQTQVAKLSNLVLDYEQEVLTYQQELQTLKNQSYTNTQVATMERRLRELEQISLELYMLVKTNLPDAELPDFDNPILPDDPLPTAAELETKWRTEQGIPAESSLTDEQTTALTEYIRQQYTDWPYPPTYPVIADPEKTYTDQELRNIWMSQNEATAPLTDEQERDVQAYIDFYEYTVRALATPSDPVTPAS